MRAAQGCTPAELALLRSQLDSGSGCVPCTSMGRLFDAVASLLGVRHRICYEGQAAIELEELAASIDEDTDDLPPLRLTVGADGLLDPAPVFRDIVTALRDGVSPARLAAAFHEAVAVAVAAVVTQVAGPVRLAGGVFQNVLLSGSCRQRLEEAGFTVRNHRLVPPNDGGLALGQAAVSALIGLDERRAAERDQP